MRIVWDEPKRLANIRKHGIDFARAADFDWSRAVVVPARGNRYKAIGDLSGEVVSVIFARLSAEAISIISMRQAHATERNPDDQAKGIHRYGYDGDFRPS